MPVCATTVAHHDEERRAQVGYAAQESLASEGD
jgi:hypothetical protein